MNCTIVGKGRIGCMLHEILPQSVLVGRAEPIPSEHPIIVATRCDDLDDVFERVNPQAREKMIFVQNGMLYSWLAQRGLEEATQALLYVAVSRKGAAPVDGGRTVVTGPQAEFFRSVLEKGGMKARSIDAQAYRRELVEKFVWNCGFGLLCSYFSCSVGDVVNKHRDHAEILLWELACDTAALLKVSIDREVCSRLCNYSLSIASYRGSVKEWKWRNGWLWERKKGVEHSRYVEALALPCS